MQPAANYTKIEYNLSKIVHWVLIIATVIMPISGFIMSGAGGYGVSMFGLEFVAVNFDPVAKKAIAHNVALAGFMSSTHAPMLFGL